MEVFSCSVPIEEDEKDILPSNFEEEVDLVLRSNVPEVRRREEVVEQFSRVHFCSEEFSDRVEKAFKDKDRLVCEMFTGDLFKDPVNFNGRNYERKSLFRWFEINSIDPHTREKVDIKHLNLRTNFDKLGEVTNFREKMIRFCTTLFQELSEEIEKTKPFSFDHETFVLLMYYLFDRTQELDEKSIGISSEFLNMTGNFLRLETGGYESNLINFIKNVRAKAFWKKYRSDRPLGSQWIEILTSEHDVSSNHLKLHLLIKLLESYKNTEIETSSYYIELSGLYLETNSVKKAVKVFELDKYPHTLKTLQRMKMCYQAVSQTIPILFYSKLYDLYLRNLEFENLLRDITVICLQSRENEIELFDRIKILEYVKEKLGRTIDCLEEQHKTNYFRSVKIVYFHLADLYSLRKEHSKAVKTLKILQCEYGTSIIKYCSCSHASEFEMKSRISLITEQLSKEVNSLQLKLEIERGKVSDLEYCFESQKENEKELKELIKRKNGANGKLKLDLERMNELGKGKNGEIERLQGVVERLKQFDMLCKREVVRLRKEVESLKIKNQKREEEEARKEKKKQLYYSISSEGKNLCVLSLFNDRYLLIGREKVKYKDILRVEINPFEPSHFGKMKKLSLRPHQETWKSIFLKKKKPNEDKLFVIFDNAEKFEEVLSLRLQRKGVELLVSHLQNNEKKKKGKKGQGKKKIKKSEDMAQENKKKKQKKKKKKKKSKDDDSDELDFDW